ncbi:MAG: hypothetical protein KGL39_13820 [Patescibacteria group bacterium]|nr:hypothetical protein [Patescibacteria group bacterium]
MKTRTALAFANWLDKLSPERFDQSVWATRMPCGTVACVAGNFCIWRGLREVCASCLEVSDVVWFAKSDGTFVNPSEFAQRGLGLSDDQRRQMFSIYALHRTPKQAAEAIRKMVARELKKKEVVG